MGIKKLTLIIDDNKREVFEIEAFEVSYNLYNETDIAIIINTKQENVVAEGVLKPSKQGIYKDKLEDTEIKNTLYITTYEQFRDKFRSKIILEVSKDYLFIGKMSLSTGVYSEINVIGAIKELTTSEETLIKDDFIKVIKEPRIEFVKEGYLKITEEVEVYKKQIEIEDAKVKEINNG